MLAPFRRGVGDLTGVGIRLDARQVAMLGQDRGLALVAWALPDPYNFLEGANRKFEVEHPVRGWEPVLHPVVLEYDNTNPEEHGTGYYAEGQWRNQWTMTDFVEQVHDTDWLEYPSLIGTANLPEFCCWWPEYQVFRIWDCWPITKEQADQYARIAAEGWFHCKQDELNHLIQIEEGHYELCEDEPEEMALLKQLRDLCLDADGCFKLTEEDLTPKLQWDGHEDLRHIWANLKASSRRGWRAVELSTPRPQRSRLRYDEGVFSPWF